MGTKAYFVEKQKIAANIHTLRGRVGDRKIYATLKANGYGLGVEQMARICGENGLRCFAVADLEGAITVMQAGVAVEDILVIAPAVPAEIPELARLGVTFTVASVQDAENLSGYSVKAHVKVDTGMGRRGFFARDIGQILALYSQYPNISFTGIYTHFANGGNRKRTRLQFECFRGVLDALKKVGIDPGLRHCCASSAVFGEDDWLLDGVRIGSALLGRVAGLATGYGLQRTGVCQAMIESVRTLSKGSPVGYGSLYRARREMRIAVCTVGTHNGIGVAAQMGEQCLWEESLRFLRIIRNRIVGRSVPVAIIAGKRCRVVGMICAEMVMLDVTDVPCQAGDMAQFDANPMLLCDMPVEFI